MKEDPSLIHLCSVVTGDGKPGYTYLSVPLSRLEAFIVASRSDQVNLPDFGKILFSGYGETPPPEVKEMVSELYPSISRELEVV